MLNSKKPSVPAQDRGYGNIFLCTGYFLAGCKITVENLGLVGDLGEKD
jgi:hypothetical protein